MPMRADVKILWQQGLADLRQGTRRLRLPKSPSWSQESDQFCCWGVLCEVASRFGQCVWVEPTEVSDGYYRFTNGERAALMPPKQLIEWAEIDRLAVPDNDVTIYLSNINDNGSNFAFISNEIGIYL